MSVVEEVLATRLDLLGVGGYVGGFHQAATALGLFRSSLTATEKAQVGLNAAVAARAGGASKAEAKAAAEAAVALRLEAEAAQHAQLGLGFAAGAVAAGGFAFLGRAALAAGEDQEIFNRAARNFKGSFPASEISDFTGGLEQATGVADDSIASFLGLLGTFRVTGDQARQLAEPILNASEALKAQGVTTEELAVQIGKAFQTGDAGPLRRVGVIIDDVGFKSLDSAGRVAALSKALNDQGGATAARDSMNSLGGSIRAALTAGQSLEEAFGAPLVGPLTAGAKIVTSIAYSFQNLPGPVQTCITLIGVGLVGALTVYSAGTVIAIGLTARLAAEQLKAADAAKKMADANSQAGNAAASGAGKGSAAALGVPFAIGAAANALGHAAFGGASGLLPDTEQGRIGKAVNANIEHQLLDINGGGLFVAGATLFREFTGGLGSSLSPAERKKAKDGDLLEQIAASTAKTAQNTDPSKLPLGTKDIAGARQIGALNLAKALT